MALGVVSQQKGVRVFFDTFKRISLKRARGQTLSSELIWVLFLNKLGKKLN